jgi:hypothetical protein
MRGFKPYINFILRKRVMLLVWIIQDASMAEKKYIRTLYIRASPQHSLF